MSTPFDQSMGVRLKIEEVRNDLRGVATEVQRPTTPPPSQDERQPEQRRREATGSPSPPAKAKVSSGAATLIATGPDLPLAMCLPDLIYAFSVFTHLSEKTAHVALKTLRDYIADDGALAITIRPPEYWHLTEREEMLEEHNRHRFAFVPHERPPIDGDIIYGDTSMAVDYIAQEFPYWKIVREHTSREDPLQTFLMLVPA